MNKGGEVKIDFTWDIVTHWRTLSQRTAKEGYDNYLQSNIDKGEEIIFGPFDRTQTYNSAIQGLIWSWKIKSSVIYWRAGSAL